MTSSTPPCTERRDPRRDLDAPAPSAVEASAQPSASAALPRYVRVLRRGPGDLVVFEFAIGWPDLCAELVMPQQAFEDFVAAQAATVLTEGAPPASSDESDSPDGD